MTSRILAFFLAVLSALPFTAPFKTFDPAPLRTNPIDRTIHLQAPAGSEDSAVDPSALTIPPLDRLDRCGPVDDVAVDVPAPVDLDSSTNGSVLKWIMPVHAPVSPSSRPVVLRL